MEQAKFLESGLHFCNFSDEQLSEVIDWEGVQALADCPHNADSVRLLSQYMVGNVSDTFAEIRSFRPIEQRQCLHTWVEVLAEGQHRQLCIDLLTNLVVGL